MSNGARTRNQHSEPQTYPILLDREPHAEGVQLPPAEAASIPSPSIPDAVEAALAAALVKATSAAEWTVVKALVGELEARRAARAGVIDLAEARRVREGR